MSILNSFFWKFIERFSSQILNFIIQTLLAILIDTSEFGTLAIVMAFINFASIFIQNGISTYIVVKKDLDDVDISTILCSSMIIASVGYMILFIISPLCEAHHNLPNLSRYIRILALVLFLLAFNAVFTGLLERKMQFKALFFRSFLAIPISGGIGVWMAYNGYGIYSLIAQTLLNQLILSIILFVSGHKRFPLAFSLEKLKETYKFCIPIMIQSAVGEWVNMSKSLTISKLYSTEDLAYYDKGSSYSNYIFQSINTPILHVLLPAFSKWQSDEEKLKNVYIETVKINNIVSLPIIIGFASISRVFVLFFLKQKWFFAIDYIIAFCVIRALYVSINLNIQMLYVLKKSRQVMVMSLIVTLLSFIAFFFSRGISPMAIVIGEIIVTSGFLLFTILYIKIALGVSVGTQLKGYICPFIGVSIMALLVFFIGIKMEISIISLLSQILVGGLCYVSYCLIFFRREMMYLFNRIKSTIRR